MRLMHRLVSRESVFACLFAFSLVVVFPFKENIIYAQNYKLTQMYFIK